MTDAQWITRQIFDVYETALSKGVHNAANLTTDAIATIRIRASTNSLENDEALRAMKSITEKVVTYDEFLAHRRRHAA